MQGYEYYGRGIEGTSETDKAALRDSFLIKENIKCQGGHKLWFHW